MKPKVFRLKSVRNLSGRLVISLPRSQILPEVGLVMQPIRLNRVVFPEPLGPLNTVVIFVSNCMLIPWIATNSLGLPVLKDLLTALRSIILKGLPHNGIRVDDRCPPGRNDGSCCVGDNGKKEQRGDKSPIDKRSDFKLGIKHRPSLEDRGE